MIFAVGTNINKPSAQQKPAWAKILQQWNESYFDCEELPVV
jgi:hypothetical protein